MFHMKLFACGGPNKGTLPMFHVKHMRCRLKKRNWLPQWGELSAEETKGGNVSHETLPDKHIHVLNAQSVVEREVDTVADHTRGAAHKTVNAPGRNEHSAQGLVL